MTTPCITVKAEKFTPAVAKDLLEKNNHGNRPISQKRVTMYAADMKRARWKPTGETIKFDTNGKLLDGQHRLRAVIESNSTIEMLVARNVPIESFKIIDTGKMRSQADVLAIDGVDHALAKTISSGAILSVTYEKMGQPRFSTGYVNLTDLEKNGDLLSNVEVVNYVRADQRFIEEAKFIHENYAKTAPMSRGQLLFVLHQTRKVALNKDRADLFVLDIIQGTMLSGHDPVMMLRNGLIQAKTSGRNMRIEVVMAGVVRAWNMRQANRSVKTKGVGSMFRRDWGSDFPRFT